MKILNLTQHIATPEQIQAGVFESKNKDIVKKLLTFENLPDSTEIWNRAYHLANLAKEEFIGYSRGGHAMIGGAGFLMGQLEKQLIIRGVTPIHSFSQRVSVETQNEDGTVTKSNVFKHVGFVFV